MIKLSTLTSIEVLTCADRCLNLHSNFNELTNALQQIQTNYETDNKLAK